MSFMDSTPRILVLDDEPMILLDLSVALRQAGYEPLTARSASKALSITEAGGLSGAVLDVNLGGGKTCEGVAEALSAQGVPFLLHSGDLDRQGELIGRFGARIVPKPAPGTKVADAVGELLAESRTDRLVGRG